MKKRGSALVFSVLMLAFFLALSLNIYFLARKKAERAGVKVAGEVTTNNIDIASSIGYQELLTAASFTINGFLYDPSHEVSDQFTNEGGLPDHSAGDPNPLYLDLTTGYYTSKYAGIHLNNFLHYFSSAWHYDNGNASDQKLVIGEILDDEGNVESRTWQSAGVTNKLSYLWNEGNTAKSLGGYSLVGTYSSDLSTEVDLSSSSISEINLAAVYEKTVRLSGYSDLDSIDLAILVTENFTYSKSDGIETLTDRELSSFAIEVVSQ